MNLFKRILCLATALLLAFALCACGGNKPADEDTNQTTTTTNAMGGNLDGENQFNDGMFGEW